MGGKDARRRVRIRVEGCLDAVLAKIVLRLLGVEPEIPLPRGGKEGVIRDVMGDIRKGIRVIGFIDADKDAERGLKQAEARIAREIKSPKLAFETRAKPIPHLLIRSNGSLRAAILVWGEPPSYSSGTIENLVCSFLKEHACKEAEKCLLDAASTLEVCKASKRSAFKLAPLTLLGVCTDASTLVYDNEHRRCGFDPAPVLERLARRHREVLDPYIRVLDVVLREFGVR